MRYIIGFLIMIGLIIFVLVLIFRGSGSAPAPKEINMLDYANSSNVVQLTNEGPVSADQMHREVRVTVGNDQTTIEVFQGYQQTLLKSQTYPNNSSAYADFLRALQLAGYTKGNTDKQFADERGYCPSGNRYVFNIKDADGSDIERFWSSSCNQGTFKGKTDIVLDLFRRQVPDYDAITTGVF